MTDLENRKGKSSLHISDIILAKTVLPFTPRFLTPNYLTIIRFILTPFVFYLLLREEYLKGMVVFALVAFTDALDGAIARVHHRISRFGKIADPLADKILVGGVALILISRFIGWWLVVPIVAVEVIIAGAAIFKLRQNSTVKIQSNWSGKTKMILQCFGILFLFGFALWHINILLLVSMALLMIAVIFAIISMFSYNSI